jgi:NAD(P) transhydrogenase
MERIVSSYDLIAIGAGPAGDSATELASAFGYRCLIIEKNKPGGTVTTTGGVPTKTLREAALYFTGFKDKDVYGVHLQTPPELALDAIRDRTRRVCENLQQATYESFFERGIDYLQGEARLGVNKSVIISLPHGGQRILEAKVILIATGSRPIRPTSVPIDHPGICDTDTILNRGRAPKSLLIIGAGPVGIEFATIAHALQIPVTLVDRGTRLLSMMDGELSSRLKELFSIWGVKIIGGSTLEQVNSKGDELDVLLTTGENIKVDTVLFAAGRAANIEGLNLEALGVKCDPQGRIIVDDTLCTSVQGIYAAGDVLKPTLASVAMEQGRIAVCHAFGIPFEGTIDPTPVSAVYGMPEVAGSGLTEEQCKEKGLDYEIGRSELSATPRGAIAGRGGLLKLIFLKSNRKVIGAHCIGDIASELVGFGQMAIRCGATLDTIVNMSMNTPTYSYAYKYAAFDGLQRLIQGEIYGTHLQSIA